MRTASICLVLACGLSARAAADPPTWPKVVTRAWLGEFSKGAWPMGKLVDPSRGLVVARFLTDSPKDGSSHVGAAKLCGQDLAKQLPTIEHDARTLLALDGAVIECHNRPGPPYCTYVFPGEWAIRTYLVFRPGDDGALHLDAVATVDGDPGPHVLDEPLRNVRAMLAKARATTCDGKPDAPYPYADLGTD